MSLVFSFWKIVSIMYPSFKGEEYWQTTIRAAIVVAYPSGNKGIHCIPAIPYTMRRYLRTCLFQLRLYSKISTLEKKRIASTLNALVWLSNSYIVALRLFFYLVVIFLLLLTWKEVITVFVKQFTLAWTRSKFTPMHFYVCRKIGMFMHSEILLLFQIIVMNTRADETICRAGFDDEFDYLFHLPNTERCVNLCRWWCNVFDS